MCGRYFSGNPYDYIVEEDEDSLSRHKSSKQRRKEKESSSVCIERCLLALPVAFVSILSKSLRVSPPPPLLSQPRPSVPETRQPLAQPIPSIHLNQPISLLCCLFLLKALQSGCGCEWFSGFQPTKGCHFISVQGARRERTKRRKKKKEIPFQYRPSPIRLHSIQAVRDRRLLFILHLAGFFSLEILTTRARAQPS